MFNGGQNVTSVYTRTIGDSGFYFDVFLTVHHSIDFSKYQLSAQFF